MKTVTDILEAKTSQLVVWYNERADKPIKKFRDRHTAEQRCLALLGDGQREEKPHAKKKAWSTANRAEGVSASWQDPTVAAARQARHTVQVNGHLYRSVRAAFKALELPDNKHQAFRKQLVAQGKAEFEGHKFTLA